MKRSKAYEDFMVNITPEEKEEFDREFQESLDHSIWMEDNGYEYCTDTSPSLMTIIEHGFSPIAITSHFLEETFVFNTKKEADRAYKRMEKKLGLVSGWWYGRKDWEKELADSIKKGEYYENGHPKIYTL